MTLPPKPGADCSDWSGGTESAQPASVLEFTSGNQRFDKDRRELRNGLGTTMARSRTFLDTRTVNDPVAATRRAYDDSPAPIAGSSEWSTMPPGMRGGRVGVRIGGMRALKADHASEPPESWQVVDTPGFGPLSRTRSGLHPSRRNRMPARSMEAVALPEPLNTMLVGSLDAGDEPHAAGSGRRRKLRLARRHTRDPRGNEADTR